jgi:hypothetical protein
MLPRIADIYEGLRAPSKSSWSQPSSCAIFCPTGPVAMGKAIGRSIVAEVVGLACGARCPQCRIPNPQRAWGARHLPKVLQAPISGHSVPKRIQISSKNLQDGIF